MYCVPSVVQMVGMLEVDEGRQICWPPGMTVVTVLCSCCCVIGRYVGGGRRSSDLFVPRYDCNDCIVYLLLCDWQVCWRWTKVVRSVGPQV